MLSEYYTQGQEKQALCFTQLKTRTFINKLIYIRRSTTICPYFFIEPYNLHKTDSKSFWLVYPFLLALAIILQSFFLHWYETTVGSEII